MFSKAKRFDSLASTRNQTKVQPKREVEKLCVKVTSASKPAKAISSSKDNFDTHSLCSSTHSSKSFKTPRPVKSVTSMKTASSVKKTLLPSSKNFDKKCDTKLKDDLIQAHEVEIRNKDYTIKEYNKQIDDLKNQIAILHEMLKKNTDEKAEFQRLDTEFTHLSLDDSKNKIDHNQLTETMITDQTKEIINQLQYQIFELEMQCEKLEKEVTSKQVEITSLDEVITIRDSLCADLQKKLTDMESCLEETRQRLEMVKGHHALALEANESIRREYKAELETLKMKLDEEKQAIMAKSKADQEIIKQKYNTLIESIKNDIIKEKDEKIQVLQHELIVKEKEIKAKLEQINEATHEKLKLCEIQFEERSRHLQEHWSQQQKEIQSLENEIKELKYSLSIKEEKNQILQKDLMNVQADNEALMTEKRKLCDELEDTTEETKKKIINFENEINKLTVQVDKTTKEKNKFEMSLSVTRDIVQVLTMRLRESDNELEHLEKQVLGLKNSKDALESELASYKNTLNNTVLECNEYKEALVNILKSKAALAKEHNRIIEHNVSLIESLQNVEKEAYRELGSIKDELIGDVELLKKESCSQIKLLRGEVEKKRVLCELATEHAGQAAAAAEQARSLLAHASSEIARLESDNRTLHQQIQDQQSLVVELSLLRQENEELTMTLAKQSSVMDKMVKDAEQVQAKPKSPCVIRKSMKIGKENIQTVISPLRERNH